MQFSNCLRLTVQQIIVLVVCFLCSRPCRLLLFCASILWSEKELHFSAAFFFFLYINRMVIEADCCRVCICNLIINLFPFLCFSLFPAAELEFVQIIIIIVVMMVMVVVIICLLNHYKLSTWSLMSRLGQARRQEHSLQPVRHRSAPSLTSSWSMCISGLLPAIKMTRPHLINIVPI